MSSPPNEALPAVSRRRQRILLGAAATLGIGALVGAAALGIAIRAYEVVPPGALLLKPAPATDDADADSKRVARLLCGLAPRGTYVVVDRTNNRLWVRRGDEILLDAACSAGSGRILDDPSGNRSWIFDTPTGVFHIRAVARNPVWRRPDWAFLEEGRPIPSRDSERYEAGVLGEYALDLGDGYLIHGTLYERLLGRSVTHGCIRLGKDDLRALVELTRSGSQVYIF